MKHNSGFLALIFSSLMMVITFFIFQTPNVGSRGLIVDYWTVPHFLFGATLFFIWSFFMSLTNRVSKFLQALPGVETVLTVLAILMWEVYELVENPSFWSSTLINNVMDVSVGLIGLKVGILIEEWILSEFPNKNSVSKHIA
jgi:hypothetical protein